MIETTPFAAELPWSRLKEMVRMLSKKELMSRFHRVSARHKADGSLVTAADRAMQQAVELFLHEQWPEYAFLGEESECETQNRALAQRQGCWILDPLDGTTNFIHGFELFSCSLALAISGEVVLGIVYDPVRDEIFAARRGLGAELNGQPLGISGTARSLDSSLALVDYKRLPCSLAASLVEAPPFASQRNLGSVALDWCWMATSRADLYLHGGQKLWDYAAGQLIFSEAGGASCTLDAEPVPANSMEPRSAVAAGTSALLGLWMAHLDASQ
ncbi:inositol monophosphatase family protein [Thiolapillus sp.]